MKNRYVLLIDLLLVPLSVIGAFVGRYDFALSNHPELTPYLLGALVIKPAVFFSSGCTGVTGVMPVSESFS